MKTLLSVGGELVFCELVVKPNRNAYLRLRPDGSIRITANAAFGPAQVEAFVGRHAQRILRARREMLAKDRLPDGTIRLWGAVVPRPADWSEASYKAEILKAAADATADLPTALSTLVPAGVRFRARLMKTRFGSNALQTRTITMNTALARFDRRYFDAILIHELCHFAHPDHGAGFYRTLLSQVPEYRRLRRELGTLFRRMEV
ncbi:MAG: YgjP-like metallopeptidase domain-containing protein [Candidatus Izemoplasmatales bacterium]